MYPPAYGMGPRSARAPEFPSYSDGDIREPQVIASKAHEHGPKEKQADLLDHAYELEQLRAWNDEGKE